MSIYDCIPIEHHGMSEWTFFVFVVAGIITGLTIKIFETWRANHDKHMAEQVKRIDAHAIQLNAIGTDLVVIKNDIGHVKESVTRMEKPLKDMSELTTMVINKVLEEKGK